MDRTVCEHFNQINKCAECDSKVYKAKVVFWVKTKLGVWVEDEIIHVDYAHADRWVKRMGDKIINPTIIY